MMHRLLPIVFVIFAIAVVLLYVRPTFSGTIADSKSKIASYTSALAAADRFQQKEAELTQQKAQISQDSLDRLAAFLPTGVDNVQLILDLDALAARSGVTLSDFNVSDDSSSASSNSNGSGQLALSGAGPVDSLDLTMSASGSYQGFRTFLSGIEQSLRPLDVTSLTVKDSATGVYTYQMTVRIYWLK